VISVSDLLDTELQTLKYLRLDLTVYEVALILLVSAH